MAFINVFTTVANVTFTLIKPKKEHKWLIIRIFIFSAGLSKDALLWGKML